MYVFPWPKKKQNGVYYSIFLTTHKIVANNVEKKKRNSSFALSVCCFQTFFFTNVSKLSLLTALDNTKFCTWGRRLPKHKRTFASFCFVFFTFQTKNTPFVTSDKTWQMRLHFCYIEGKLGNSFGETKGD